MPSVGNGLQLSSQEHLKRTEFFPKNSLKIINSRGEFEYASNTEFSASEKLPNSLFKLLPGECVEYFGHFSNCASTNGIWTGIFLTNYRIFVNLDKNSILYNIPVRCVDIVELRDLFYVFISCKDGKVAKLSFDNSDCSATWFRVLGAASTPPPKLDSLFAFAFNAWSKDDDCPDPPSSSDQKFRDGDYRNRGNLKIFSGEDRKKKTAATSLTCCYSEGKLQTRCGNVKSSDRNDHCETNDGFCGRSLRSDHFLKNESDRSGAKFERIFWTHSEPDSQEAGLAEFDRLNFDRNLWRLTDLNKNYEFCPTYPKNFIVPNLFSDQNLDLVAQYRSMRRVPAVVWRHSSNGTVLVRCSQPENGIFGWRSPVDESLLGAILEAARKSVPKNWSDYGNGTKCAQQQQMSMLILDARSYAAAWANRAKGGGFESAEYYRNCEMQFLGLANIHSIRYSFQKLRTLCWADQSAAAAGWFQNLDATQWVSHLAALMSSALRVVESMCYEKRSVVVHCSDGWDRTTQIVSLAKLIMDPYYRTFKGFKELVEREWVAFGHKFGERSGLITGDVNQRAPVFLQWLDCVHHLYSENCTAFEFNEVFLVKLAQHTFSGLFGTFLCNSAKEHLANNVSSRTFSIWSYLNPHNAQFRNLLFVGPQSIEYGGGSDTFLSSPTDGVASSHVTKRRQPIENDVAANGCFSQNGGFDAIDHGLVEKNVFDGGLVKNDVIMRRLVRNEVMDGTRIGCSSNHRQLFVEGPMNDVTSNGLIKNDVTRRPAFSSDVIAIKSTNGVALAERLVDGGPDGRSVENSFDGHVLRHTSFRMRDLSVLWQILYCPPATNGLRPVVGMGVSPSNDWSSSTMTSSSLVSDDQSERTLMALSSMALLNQSESIGLGDCGAEGVASYEGELNGLKSNSKFEVDLPIKFDLTYNEENHSNGIEESVVRNTLDRLITDIATHLAVEEACLDSVVQAPPSTVLSRSFSGSSNSAPFPRLRLTGYPSPDTRSTPSLSLGINGGGMYDAGLGVDAETELNDGFDLRAATVILTNQNATRNSTLNRVANAISSPNLYDGRDSDELRSNGISDVPVHCFPNDETSNLRVAGLFKTVNLITANSSPSLNTPTNLWSKPNPENLTFDSSIEKEPSDETSTPRVVVRSFSNLNVNGKSEPTRNLCFDPCRKTVTLAADYRGDSSGGFAAEATSNDEEEGDDDPDLSHRLEQAVPGSKNGRKKRKKQSRKNVDLDGLTRVPNEIQDRIFEIVLDYEERLESLQREIERLKTCLFKKTATSVRVRNESLRSRRYTSGESSSELLETLPLNSAKANNFSDTSWEAVDEADLATSPPRLQRQTTPLKGRLLQPQQLQPQQLPLSCRSQSGVVPAKATLWAPDHSAPKCTQCGVEFWAVVRRHHCRSCGLLFCNACTNYESVVPSQKFHEPVRVCHDCFSHLNQHRQQKVSV